MSQSEEPPSPQPDDAGAQQDQSVEEFVKEVEEDPASNPPEELDDIRGG